jgi:hypothetical protein
MPATTRTFATYQKALTCAYEEEVGGEAFFAALAQRYGAPACEILKLFTRIEAITAAAIAPLMKRNGFPNRALPALAAEGAKEAAGRPALSWPDYLAKIVRDYPVYMPEFQQVIDLAPDQDRAALLILPDHEQAMIDYAAAALCDDPRAADHLFGFITRYTPEAPFAASVLDVS